MNKVEKIEKSVSLDEIVQGLSDGSITILEVGHLCNPLLDMLENKLGHINDQIRDYQDKIDRGETKVSSKSKSGGEIDCQSMIDFYNVNKEVRVGKFIMSAEQYCFNCGENMYIVLIDEKTLGYIPSGEYWKIADASGKKYGYAAKREDCPCCSATPFVEAKKLTATINAPTGNIIFQNYFKEEKLYKYQGEGYNSINAVQGRNELMQDMASRDVGYGQMGNMSVTIYSNGKEVLIGSDLECYEDNKAYSEENPKEDAEWDEEVRKAEEFKKMLKDGKFKNLGDISLSVWRWMCADADTLKKYKEKPSGNAIKVKLKPGTYTIEHYYDFPENGDYLYSRIMLK
jgi:hypothetical protein